MTSAQWIEYQMHCSQLEFALLQCRGRHRRNGQGDDPIITGRSGRFRVDEGQG